MNPEEERIAEKHTDLFIQKWEKWGPFVFSRCWGNVREDYSANGDAWNYFPHEHARKRAYRWGDDGIAGLCDRFQVMLFAPAFWNGNDPILKERLFGLNSNEGNHGEDLKELFYYLDSTPTCSYLKCLYKYPQAAFPYDQLVQVNASRSTKDREFELVDTGIFDQDRYFDITMEYAKADAEDLCIRIEAINRGPDPAPLHILPQLWFRNQWSWTDPTGPEPAIQVGPQTAEAVCLLADDTNLPSPNLVLGDYHLGERYLYASRSIEPELLFTNNDTDCETIWKKPNASPYVKDGIDRYVVQGQKNAVNPDKRGTKAAIHYFFKAILPGQSVVVTLRLTSALLDQPLKSIESIIAKRKEEADQFYSQIHLPQATAEEKMIQRQAFAGFNWHKKLYFFFVSKWLNGDAIPPPPSHAMIRNTHWCHLASFRIMSVPDSWEYPWFAAWDLSFHTVAFSLIDLEVAKDQLSILFVDRFQHPNGQIPAYEWEFSDVNPPVQAWAALKIFEREKEKTGTGDYHFLEKCFHRLLLNFAWWVNKVDAKGNNVFEGGFLGMDNIGLFNRSRPLPEGVILDEIDGVGWVAHLCLSLMRMSLTLAEKNPVYESMGIKFLYHYAYIIDAMRNGRCREYDLWSAQDGFFYSHIIHPDGSVAQVPIRSLTGIVPFFASDVWDEEEFKKFPHFYRGYEWLTEKRPDLAKKCIHQVQGKLLFSPMTTPELTRFLTVLWDPNEFRSDYGLRSLSKFHLNNPYTLNGTTISYEKAESLEKIMGGNSNWRGPIWVPANYMFIQTLNTLSGAFKDTLTVQIKGEKPATIHDMSAYFSECVVNLFKENPEGKRPLFGETSKFQTDPHFKDNLLFYEYYDGDNGRGCGASHQGWTGLVANLINEKGRGDPA